jgi:hypothetical protein
MESKLENEARSGKLCGRNVICFHFYFFAMNKVPESEKKEGGTITVAIDFTLSRLL